MTTQFITAEGKALLERVRKTRRFATQGDADAYFANLPPLPYGSNQEPSLRLTDEEKVSLAQSETPGQ